MSECRSNSNSNRMQINKKQQITSAVRVFLRGGLSSYVEFSGPETFGA
jgi:hypothetical protein